MASATNFTLRINKWILITTMAPDNGTPQLLVLKPDHVSTNADSIVPLGKLMSQRAHNVETMSIQC